MFTRIFNLRNIELTFMNELPTSARNAGMTIFRDYHLDELVAMRMDHITPELPKQFKLSPDIWQLTLNTVILTKLSTFNIHPYLSADHLTKLRQIAALAFGQKQPNIADMIEKAQTREAEILEEWLKQLRTAIAKKKA